MVVFLSLDRFYKNGYNLIIMMGSVYMFIGFYNKSIILTFIGLFCSVFGMKFSIDGNYSVSLVFLLLSGICDTFDGTVANLVKRDEEEKKYGVELDSLVDLICFGVFPIIISIGLGYNSIFNMIVYCIFIFCGVTRLAFFNIDQENKKCFKGLPITMSSFILPIITLISTSEIVIMLTLLVLSFLFLFNFKIPKSDLKLKFLYLVIGVGIIGLVILKLFLMG